MNYYNKLLILAKILADIELESSDNLREAHILLGEIVATIDYIAQGKLEISKVKMEIFKYKTAIFLKKMQSDAPNSAFTEDFLEEIKKM